jgi:AcrR family transcriptional regulator
MPTAVVRDADLTARARIREKALALFAEQGVAATSLRAVAQAAGVSPALIIHHFGSKAGLRRAVDDAVTDAFREQFAHVDPESSPDVFSARAGEAFAAVVGANSILRRYLRRSVLEASPDGAALLDRLLAWTTRGLDAFERDGALRPGTDPTWRPYQVLFVMLGPLLLEPLLEQHLGADAFEPGVVAARSRANFEFFAHGLLADAPREQAVP